MAAIILLVRALAQGASGFIIDRAGHFDFLCSLIPGGASLQVGAGAHAINSWDVEDPAQVGAEKIDYLLALHALLLGEHHAGRDSYGLSDLEANLLGLAIAEVYARCALTGEEPRELLLQEELERRYHQERSEGSVGIAESLRNLSMRLNNYIGDGPYAYLADRPTTIPADAPLVVFDTRSIPDAKAAAALFVICEHVKSRIARTRQQHLAGESPKHAWAGKSLPRGRRGVEADRAAQHGPLVQRVLPAFSPLRAVADRDQPAALGLRQRARPGAFGERRDAAVPAPRGPRARLRQGRAEPHG